MKYMAQNKEMTTSLDQRISRVEAFQANTIAIFKNLEKQIQQIAQEIQEQPTRTVPSDAHLYPKECMATSLSVVQEISSTFNFDEEIRIISCEAHKANKRNKDFLNPMLSYYYYFFLFSFFQSFECLILFYCFCVFN